MRTRIIFRFIIIYILIGLGGFILISTAGSKLVEKRLIDIYARSLNKEAIRIAGDKSAFDGENSSLALYNNLTYLSTYQNCEFWIIDSRGNIILNSAEPYEEGYSEPLEEFDPISLGSASYVIGDFFGHFSGSRLSVLAPLASDLRIYGYVAIHMDMNDIYTLRESYLAVVHLVCWTIYFAFLIIFLLFFISILRPLKKITTGAKEYAAGNLKYSIPGHSRDELGNLASSLNYMAKELQKSDDYQKTFIANVSHDFRSPLTSIKGYAEAMLDGTIPPELQGKYLQIILSETQRLTKLTEGILTLNNMDEQRSGMLNISAFDINKVIRNTAAAFEGICTPRHISFNLLLTEEELFVSADKDKIQQVLYNLIDNAIKFSRDQSNIALETAVRKDQVYVSVRDHGQGIPRSSLTKIWDRFYKTDASRGRERKGNGLGLAIVKEIISQHGKEITVISTEGVGSEFVFPLDLAKK